MAAEAISQAHQAFITEMWAMARYEAEQLGPDSAKAVEFFNSRNSPEPQDIDLRSRIITAWQCAKSNALKEAGITVLRLEGSVKSNAILQAHFKAQEAFAAKPQDPDAPKPRRNSADFSAVIRNFERFIAEAKQKRNALLTLPETPFGFR